MIDTNTFGGAVAILLITLLAFGGFFLLLRLGVVTLFWKGKR